MERTVTDHEIKGEHKLIREITTTYYTTSDGVEHKGNPHRGPQCAPGKLDGETYIKTDVNDLPRDVKSLAGIFWDTELHHSYEAFLVKQQQI